MNGCERFLGLPPGNNAPNPHIYVVSIERDGTNANEKYFQETREL